MILSVLKSNKAKRKEIEHKFIFLCQGDKLYNREQCHQKDFTEGDI